MRKWIPCFLCLVFSLSLAHAGQHHSSEPPILASVKKKIQTVLDHMDGQLAKAADRLGKTGFDEPQTREILQRLFQSTPYVVDACTVDRNGIMRMVEPQAYQKHEGADISKQEQILRLHRTRKPVLSQSFRAVEGFDAVDLEWPVIAEQNVLIGSVSLLIRPESLLGELIVPDVKGFPVDFWVMQTDGRILYDFDVEEIGRNVFSDPIYQPFPQLRELGKTIASQRTGSGQYTFLDQGLKKSVEKKAVWETVSLHGTEWRLIMTQMMNEPTASVTRNLAQLGLDSTDKALQKLAHNPVLHKSIKTQDKENILSLFKQFYDEHPGLYSIQWIDKNDISRYGYPPQNSLCDYDYTENRESIDKNFLMAVIEKQEASFEFTLAEGSDANCYMCPINDGTHYLGLIYFLRIKP
ncbi:MAG: hypothetical protein C4527_29175 [Candidatus Omnitrophota bacterium]|jgi:hypothetical protein|nr:MAG: hypothetical protein C4527_29175 [Candidatus Omnitrophota bacterium]